MSHDVIEIHLRYPLLLLNLLRFVVSPLESFQIVMFRKNKTFEVELKLKEKFSKFYFYF